MVKKKIRGTKKNQPVRMHTMTSCGFYIKLSTPYHVSQYCASLVSQDAPDRNGNYYMFMLLVFSKVDSLSQRMH